MPCPPPCPPHPTGPLDLAGHCGLPPAPCRGEGTATG
eukprot:gene18340-biopygen14479